MDTKEVIIIQVILIKNQLIKIVMVNQDMQVILLNMPIKMHLEEIIMEILHMINALLNKIFIL